MKDIDIILVDNYLRFYGSINFNNLVYVLNFYFKKSEPFNVINLDFLYLSSINSSVLIFVLNCIRKSKKKNQFVKFLNVPKFLVELSKVCSLSKMINKV